MRLLVSIIIVNWNAGKYLKDCIFSLENQTYENFEIIMVDNASSDGSVEFVEKNFPKIRIIKNKSNVGFAEGNNIGIRNSTGDVIALFNPDAKAERNWLSTLVSVLQSSDKIAAVSGKMYYMGDQYGKDAVFCTWPKIDQYSAMAYTFHDHEPSSKVDSLTGGAMIVKKNVINKIGLLDRDYFIYFEETDWCARMIRAGYDLIYTPDAIVWHHVSATISESDKKIYFMERSRIRFALKNFDAAYLPIFILNILAETTLIFIRDVKNKRLLRSKIRLQVIFWNLSHLRDTMENRKKDMSLLKKNGFIKSYNKSLPLRGLKIK